MFEWLEREITIIKTPRFHVLDGPATGKLREAVTQSGLPLPESYREFALRFGNAKLYRNARNASYRIGVFAGPRTGRLDDGTLVYEVGFHNGARVFIEPSRPRVVVQSGKLNLVRNGESITASVSG